MRILSIVTVLATLLVAPAAAQTIRGVVVEDGARIPVDGAMVTLFDAGGEVVQRALTDGLGRYFLEAQAAGRHSIRVDRIGYESVSTGTFPVGPDGVTRNIDVPVRAIELAGLDVSGSARCQVRPAEGQATAILWEEARKALEATAWTLNQGVYRYTLLHYTRELDENGIRIENETREFIRGRSQAPYISLPAKQLVEEGFVHTLEDGSTSYFAPDAAVLLSDPFLDTHCMKIKEGRDGLVGLELKPVSGRRLPDVEGTLWLDQATGRLDRLDFRYVNLRGSSRVNGEPGGEVVFGGLPNGTWVVREWRIRMPIIAIRSDSGTLFRTGYQDEGGVVWRVRDRDGTTLLEATTATIAGFVNDSTGLGAVAGVRVSTATGEEATTGEDGSFIISGLAEGLHNLMFQHPSLDSLGLTAPASVVSAPLGDIAQTRVRLPSPSQLLVQTCGGAPRPESTSILFGRLVDGAGRPAAGVHLRLVPLVDRRVPYEVPERAAPELPGSQTLTWGATQVRGRSAVETTTDQRGIFVLCDVPTPAQVHVLVGSGSGGVSQTITLRAGIALEMTTIVLDQGGIG